jgi:hypothetical protein
VKQLKKTAGNQREEKGKKMNWRRGKKKTDRREDKKRKNLERITQRESARKEN